MLHDNMQTGIAQSRNHPVHMGLGNQCSSRASGHTLATVDTTRHVRSLIESGPDCRFGTAIDEINTGNALDFVADENAFSALDTFFGIPDN
jgi:hypothetical protein